MTSTSPYPAVSFTITAQDYANASKLHTRRYWARNPVPKLFGVGTVAAILLAMALSGINPSLTIGATGGLIALVCLSLFTYFVRIPRQARRIYGQQKTMQHPVTASWDSATFSASTKAVSGTTAWNDYYGWAADETIILFFQSPALFQMLPRHALTAEEADDLLTHLAQSGLRRL
ncbi:YcxB family protein [Devosia alba]|uniref:YcxB family protein n=1 Tax=Devosia alba TaxID=3152360 RepID=UPI0032669F97